MTHLRVRFYALLLFMGVTLCGFAQQTAPAAGSTVVPPLVKFSGILTNTSGEPLIDTVGVTFSLYKDSQGGMPLWREMQNVKPDSSGHYTVALGAGSNQGLPADLFSSGEARWLGVQSVGQPERPRMLLMSVPYALKAADAETIGGLPASAFVLAVPASSGLSSSSGQSSSNANSNLNLPPLGGSGTVNFIPLWTDSTGDLGNSALFQGGAPGTPKIGIGTTTPASTLDVKGTSTIRGLLSLPASGPATASKGSNSQALDLVASSFNSGTAKAVNETFQWQAEAVANNSSTPTGSLNLLFGSGTSKPTETGLNIASNGQITFASSQSFPGTVVSLAATAPLAATVTSGAASLQLNGCATSQVLQWNGSAWACASVGTGTITGVTAGNDLTGGGTSGNITLNLDATKVPQLSGSNTFSGNQTITGNLSVTVSGSGSASVTGNNTSQVGQVTQNGTGAALLVQQNDTGSSATDVGISATAAGTNAIAIRASSTSSSGSPTAVYGSVAAQNGTAVLGSAVNPSGGTGVVGQVLSATGGIGVEGIASASTGVAGVFDNTGSTGEVLSLRNNGVERVAVDTFGDIDTYGGQLIVQSASTPGVFNNTAGGGTILIGENKNAQKFNFDVNGTLTTSGGVSATGAVTASSFSGSGSGLTGIPQLAANNTFAGNQTVTGNVTSTGTVTGGVVSATSSIDLAGALFAFGTNSLGGNAYVGFAGTPTSTGTQNVGNGISALFSDTSGFNNVAAGYQALSFNTTGFANTGTGWFTLVSNIDGGANTATGAAALWNNISGSYNTAEGYSAGPDEAHTNLTNSTAIGAYATVTASNAMVLGSINGVNGATASTNVGIGTTAPQFPLEVVGNDNGGTGVQTVTYNTSTSGSSFAVFAATSASGVTGQMVADGLGNGPLGTPSAYFGTFGNQPIALVTHDTARLIINTSGWVGIGVTSPSNLLTLCRTCGSALADGWATYSSRRWKTNIQPLRNALGKVERLRGVSYDLKASGKHEIGVIAEEVGEVVPEVVAYEDNGKDARSVDYTRLTALLIEAVKEQERQIKTQQSQIVAQRDRLARMNEKVGKLETALLRVNNGRKASAIKAHSIRAGAETGGTR